MRNAKTEFIEHIENRTVKAVEIVLFSTQRLEINLKLRHTPGDYARFLASIDLEYDEDFGSQALFGTIWYTDGTWSERGEYDGSEWWNYCEVPPIPSTLFKE